MTTVLTLRPDGTIADLTVDGHSIAGAIPRDGSAFITGDGLPAVEARIPVDEVRVETAGGGK